MEATLFGVDRQSDPRRSAVRLYWMRILGRISQATHAYGLHDLSRHLEKELAARVADEHFFAVDAPIGQAVTLAKNGLNLLASLSSEKLPPGWAEGVIEEITSLRRRMQQDILGRRKDFTLPATVTPYFEDAFALLERSLPPEGVMPSVTFDQHKGLRVNESGARRARFPRLTGNAGILIDLLRQHPEGLTNAKMIEMTDIKDPGRTLLDVLRQYPEFRGKLHTPNRRGGRSRGELVYRLDSTTIAIDAPPSPSNRPLVSPKLCA